MRRRGRPPDECVYPEPQLSDYLNRRPFAEVGAAVTPVDRLSGRRWRSSWSAGTFIGAEYTTGAIANWLTFVPQRGRVYAAKVLTIAGCRCPASARWPAALVLLVAVVLAAAYANPLTTAAPACSPMAGRGRGPRPSPWPCSGFCIALLTRHTVAASARSLGYLFVWFVRVALLSEPTWRGQARPLGCPRATSLAFLDKGTTYAVPIRSRDRRGGLSDEYVERHDHAWAQRPGLLGRRSAGRCSSSPGRLPPPRRQLSAPARAASRPFRQAAPG